ncbi:MAG: hypothetical protein JSV84_03705 [Gemmatimonadota bacterium]|nr:MAG: hypothetical protein JSV84_03705 [Gemmatimonadota bacterium]
MATLFKVSSVLLIICTAGLFVQCSSSEKNWGITQLINLQHLDYLNEHVEIDGTFMIISHIYSEHPDYQWVEAEGEGIACVDDVARSVLVYLKHYELIGDNKSLEKAKRALNFVMYMEEDGEFFNFIHKDHTINVKGRTSQKSFSFWAVRGLRALCHGYRVFNTIDVLFADSLRTHIERTFVPLRSFLKNHGKYSSVAGIQIPDWLVSEGGDATSEVVLALLDYWSIHPDPRVEEMIRMFAQALVEYQLGRFDRFPYGAHLSWKNYWHAWGNGQVQALARAGRIFGEREWMASAQTEADNFYIHLISENFLHSFEVSIQGESKIDRFPQISYGIRPMVSGLIELYETTGDDKYAKLAGLVASWLRGNNPARREMYCPETGRGYDGINSPSEINLNSGAESTLEALMILLTIVNNPVAEKYYHYGFLETINGFRIYGSPEGERVAVGKDRLGKKIGIFKGDVLNNLRILE